MVNDVEYLLTINKDLKTLSEALTELSNENKDKMLVGLNTTQTKIQYILVSKNVALNCRDKINKINAICGGKGGGNEGFAQGGTDKIDKLDEIISIL
jgi:alanyl-tRNA synthetase